MKKFLTLSVITATTLAFAGGDFESNMANAGGDALAKLVKKVNKIKAHDANDNIKWSIDFRTSIDNINYDMADGSTRGKNDLMSNRLWLNMAYAADEHNVFKGQLSYNKADGAQFGQTSNPTLNPFGVRGTGFDTFDWITNGALTDNKIAVRQAYWLYLGDKAFGANIPWTFSVGRRPSVGGYLANLREDDPATSPLGHSINVEFDGFSTKLDFSNVTHIPGLTFKICGGQGSTNAAPKFSNLSGTDYQNDDTKLEDTKLLGFLFNPYNDGQYIVKTMFFKAWSMPGFDSANFFQAFGESQGAPIPPTGPAGFSQNGDMLGGAISVMVDGLTEDGYLSDAKVFGSFAFSKTQPDSGKQMLGLSDPASGQLLAGAKVDESKTGTSYWFGTQLPVGEKGILGLEYNHGSEYWRPFTYEEDTLAGSKLATRGNAIEAYFTYQLTKALSAQIRYTKMDYDYTGSNGFFASGGTPFKIDDVKNGAKKWAQLGGTADPASGATVVGNLVKSGLSIQQAKGAAGQMGLAAAMAPNIVESAQDIRFYIRYRY